MKRKKINCLICWGSQYWFKSPIDEATALQLHSKNQTVIKKEDRKSPPKT
jgi:hypothetical protein